MWQVDNRTPYAADGGWFRDGDGAEVWAVAIKATFEIRADGTLRLANEQPSISTGPVPHPGLRSPRYETDLGPGKSATDVLLIGHGYAQVDDEGPEPRKPSPVPRLRAGFRLGPIVRTFALQGDRHWASKDGTNIDGPSEFLRMPLVCERAFGGTAEDAVDDLVANPVGRGCSFDPEDDGGRIALPNIEDEKHLVQRREDRPPPMMLGVVAAHWLQRRQLAGTYDDVWVRQRRPLPPLDLDPRFFQLAVPEQQVPGHLKGGEKLTLLNLTPPGFVRRGRVDCVLPRKSFLITALFEDGRPQRMRPVIHTVLLEPDYPRLSIVYHATLNCHARVDTLRVTRIDEKERPLDPRSASVVSLNRAS